MDNLQIHGWLGRSLLSFFASLVNDSLSNRFTVRSPTPDALSSFAYFFYGWPAQIKTRKIAGSLLFALVLIYGSESKRKYWYKHKTTKPGKQLPAKYKRMFANKQIVCIEYMEISEDDEREIFRVRFDRVQLAFCGTDAPYSQRVQLGMALNYAEKMKAEAPTPRQTLVHELVSEFAMPLRNLGLNDRRDAAFRWIAQSLQTILDPRPIIKRSATTTSQQTTWLKDTAPLDPTWKKRVQHTYKLLVDTLATHPDCLKVTRGPVTIAPIDLVMMVLLVFEFQDKFSASRLADALHALRMAARTETKDLMWKSEHMGFYLVFLDRLQKLGEGALGPSSSSTKEGPAPMDVDPPAKRQRTDGVPRWFDVIRIIVLMKRDRLFVSASIFPSAATIAKTIVSPIFNTCHTAPGGAHTAIIFIGISTRSLFNFYHTHIRICRPRFSNDLNL